MRIISMATESYNDWIFSFYHSVKHFNPKAKITINLINYPNEKANFLRGYFPDVEFIETRDKFPLKETFNPENNIYKVTFLKGRFMKDALTRHQEPCLWADVTALIRTDLSDVFNQLKTKDLGLIQRQPGITQGNKAYAAEIFCMSHRDPNTIERYFLNCNTHRNLWYADQISLTKFSTTNRFHLPFGEFCNFFYEDNARTWSDRGKDGKGTLTIEDTEYTIDRFSDEMTNHIKTYKMQKGKFLKAYNQKRPKILCFIDDSKWCYLTTAQDIIKKLSKYYDFTVVRTIELDKDLLRNWNGDFIWARCGAYRAVKILALRPEYHSKIITSVTSGGEIIQDIMQRISPYIGNHLGILTQNEFTEQAIKDYGFPNLDIFRIPNGVETSRFKPMDRDDSQPLTIGFAGRIGNTQSRMVKGFDEYVRPVCESLNIRLYIGDSTTNYIPHNKMHEYYNKIDILLQPSLYEGCSNTVMEAMSCGVPCVITKTGYHGEVCKDNEVVFVERDIENIIQKIQELVKPKNYAKVSKGARKFAERHSWDKIAMKYKKCFDKCLKKIK